MPDTIAEQIAKPDPIATLRALVKQQQDYARSTNPANRLSIRNTIESIARNTDFAALLRAFEELQQENANLKARNNSLAEALEYYECPECGDEPCFCDCEGERP